MHLHSNSRPFRPSPITVTLPQVDLSPRPFSSHLSETMFAIGAAAMVSAGASAAHFGQPSFSRPARYGHTEIRPADLPAALE